MQTRTQAAATFQTACDSYPPLATKAERTPRQLRAAGWQAFCNLEDVSILTTDEERRGYFAAMAVCADIETDIYLAQGRAS